MRVEQDTADHLVLVLRLRGVDAEEARREIDLQRQMDLVLKAGARSRADDARVDLLRDGQTGEAREAQLVNGSDPGQLVRGSRLVRQGGGADAGQQQGQKDRGVGRAFHDYFSFTWIFERFELAEKVRVFTNASSPISTATVMWFLSSVERSIPLAFTCSV